VKIVKKYKDSKTAIPNKLVKFEHIGQGTVKISV